MNRRTFFAALAGLPFVRWFLPQRPVIRMANGWTIETFASSHVGMTGIDYGLPSRPYRVIPRGGCQSGATNAAASLLAMYLNHTPRSLGELEAKYAEAFREAVIYPVAPVWPAIGSTLEENDG